MERHEYTHVEEHSVWLPVTEGERDEVRRQLERLLETTHFRNSRRYPALFRFIVEETLAGRGEFLKERLLGVQVFGRPSDYDTATDPVVRVTVAEIRKRIAQYYHHEGHSHELRIELLPGRYEPEFRLSRDGRHDAADGVVPPPEAVVAQLPVVAVDPLPLSPAVQELAAEPLLAISRRKRTSSLKLWGSVTLITLAAVTIFCLATFLRPSALDQFWAPILSAHQPVVLCLPVAGGKYGAAADSRVILAQPVSGAGRVQQAPTAPRSYLELESLGENVVFSDVRAMTSLSNLLAQHGVDQRLRLNTAVTLDDLRQGPAILIGAMDNPWTLRAISHLRYQVTGNNQENYWLVDTKTGKSTGWSLDLKVPIVSVTRDYAIVARVHGEDTGRPQVIVAGIGMSGTAAAGELLTDPAQMQALRARVGPDFRTRDFEAVISTDVVNGIAGSPKILTVELH